MNNRSRVGLLLIGTAALSVAMSVACVAAENQDWQVSRATGDVWISGPGVTPVSLGNATALKSGDEIRTGKTGRVLLSRGEETIMISPNSVIAVPAAVKAGLDTIILQKAGEIVLKVEKKNSPHFEVETPYLAALVKGTRFRVVVNGAGSKVDVLEGKVQVSDFKSGKFALVLPGQSANVPLASKYGLQLSGAGALGVIEQGAPRASPVERVRVPSKGLSSPSAPPSGNVKKIQVAGIGTDAPAAGKDAKKSVGVHIDQPLGAVTLDVKAATKGVARSEASVGRGNGFSKAGAETTMWTASTGSGVGASNGISSGTSGASVSANSGGANASVGAGNAAGVQTGVSNGVSVSANVASVAGVGVDLGGGSGKSNNGRAIGIVLGKGNAYGRNK